jgi:hypothetical protein
MLIPIPVRIGTEKLSSQGRGNASNIVDNIAPVRRTQIDTLRREWSTNTTIKFEIK